VREPLIALDQDLRVITASRSFYSFFKVKPEETVGRLIYELGDKQWDIPRLRELLENILPQKTTFDSYEVEHDFATIGSRIMLLNARQIKRVFGKERIILLAIEDITERKQLEGILIDSEEQYRRLFETASDAIILLEKRKGEIANVNPATEKLLGYTNKESIGNTLQDIGVLLDMGNFQTTIQNLNKSGILNYDDVPVKTKSGQLINTDIYLANRAKLIQCNICDITERKQQEEDMLRTNTLLNSIIENIPTMLFLKNAKDLRFVRFNRAGEELLGQSRDDLIGKSDYDFFPKTQADFFTQSDRDVLFGKKLIDIPEEHIQTTQGEKILHTKKLPLLNEKGEPSFLLGISEDITEQKKNEEKLKNALENLRSALNSIIHVLVSAVESRDPYTSGHQIRTANLAFAIATEMGLPHEKIEAIRMAGPIHDIGKLSIPAEILSRPTKLTELEFSLVKEHSRAGYEILKDVESPWPLAEIVYQHHERMDGSGYPRKLKGDEILLEARIMAVADVVEAMASHRPYRPALGIDVATEEIRKNRGTLYDADAVDACLRLFREKGYRLPTA
jgi:PAS domain S-box-containing protein